MKKGLKIVFRVLLVLALLPAAGIGVLTMTEYRPDAAEAVIRDHPVKAVFHTGESLSLVTWNIGWGALGDNAGFFTGDGKAAVTADRERLQDNLNGIAETLQNIPTEGDLKPDLVLLQEVDINSDRSFRTDERAILRQGMPEGTEAFAYDFNALYIPWPLPPAGHAESGLYTLSRADIREAVRISMPCPFAWPARIVSPKRCLLVSRIPLADTDRELVVINLHLESFDYGAGREAQNSQLLEVMLNERDKGNYVIAAGDFSQRLSDAGPYRPGDAHGPSGVLNAEAFADNGFQLFMDTETPTCRFPDGMTAGAEPDDSDFYITDGIIVSGNVQVEQAETIRAGFRYSNHNPVRMTFILMSGEE